MIYGLAFYIKLNIWRRRKNAKLKELANVPSLMSNIEGQTPVGLAILCKKKKLQV